MVLLAIGFVYGVFHSIAPKNVSTPTEVGGIKCNRKEPYKLAPEFERARSLRNQRLQDAGYKLDYSFYNCIDIQYADLSPNGAEGMFQFDQNSSIDDLKILVDNSYKIKDDLLTAVLLQHEFAHVSQFVKKLRGEGETPCVDSEVQAFANEILLLTTLNEEEKMSVAQRVIYYRDGGYRDSVSLGIISQIDQLVKMNGKSKTSEALITSLDKWVRQNPAYKKQCGL